ncbi:Fe-S cluster assembly protein SufD [uncultured Limosilactobacillus sp.]|uniref:Fe-S cluster assembly protein SufD n=1 Tax=uncultured Limosilactobacillus sp. TaxID=2837629 RepID=UPI0025D73D4A|nr:Fe-S cluster assembly protein SufD [uncultured Limosilactobacillus sp.]
MTFNFEQTQQQVKAVASRWGEPTSFTARRLSALQLYPKLAMPRMQEFSYDGWPLLPTDDRLKLIDAVPSAKAVTAAQENDGDDISLHSFAQGKLVINKQVPAGVICEPFFRALHNHYQVVDQYFMSVISAEQDKLTAYHQAMLNSGTVIEVGAGVSVKQPLEIHQVQDATRPNQPLVNHLLIVAHPQSVVHVVQHLSSVGKAANLANLMVEIVAEPGSEVHLAVLDETGTNITTYLNRRAHLAADANVEWAVGMMNGGNVLGDIDAELIGEGSKADSKLIAVTGGDQHVGLNNRVTNRGPHSTGLINQRGVVLDSSELIFNGIGQIVHDAHGSNAEQQNRLLMMSPTARGDANPILLIDENDVNAGHAASVGQVDAHQLYYLLSRGIPEHQAKRMVIRGFLSAVLTALPNRRLEDKMITILERKLLHD